jgi:transcriptional regulator with XRE-family HTH domain
MSTINERFREVREILKLSQDDFAALANRTRSEIKNIEYNKTSPKEEVIKSVCSAHSINRVWLETGVGDPLQPKDKQAELKAVFADVLSGRPSDKNAFIEAVAQLPDDVFPVLVKSWITAAEEMKQKLKKEE